MLSALLPITDILGKRAVLEALGELFHSISIITRIVLWWCRRECVTMSAPIALSEAPQKLLNQRKWAEVRAFASSDLIALTYLNAPYPDEDNPRDFFWGRDGSSDQAVRCYEIGRELVGQCRHLLIAGKLVAKGTRPNGTREIISRIEWADTWPMFATNRATGPNQVFDDVEIHESTALETPDEKKLRDCMNWLRAQSAADLMQKKAMLFHRAKLEFGEKLTLSSFEAAYKAILGRSRGRPKK
jgi:hypothetical protein